MTNDSDKPIDLRESVNGNEDEADFATKFYKESWVFDQYQEDRINLFRDVLFPLVLPEGYVVMFGTHNGKVFDTWCDQWGKDKCLGFELYNDERRPQVVVMDVRGLGPWCSTPIALCWNDVGSWERTPEARRTSYEWIKSNIVKNGFYMERSDEMAGWNLSDDLIKNEFEIIQEVLGGSYVLYQKCRGL